MSRGERIVHLFRYQQGHSCIYVVGSCSGHYGLYEHVAENKVNDKGDSHYYTRCPVFFRNEEYYRKRYPYNARIAEGRNPRHQKIQKTASYMLLYKIKDFNLL